jgi:hypothetical protein
MRLAPLFAGIAVSAALASTSALATTPVALTPVQIAPELQTKFETGYGLRDIAVLQNAVGAALVRELANAGASVGDGAAPLTVQAILVDVKPSRPTFDQAIRQPNLDTAHTVSLGGAELHARLLDAAGKPVGDEIAYRCYETATAPPDAKSTWSDARRAIGGFATRVGSAYRAASAPRA